jgi:hypothetical protein
MPAVLAAASARCPHARSGMRGGGQKRPGYRFAHPGYACRISTKKNLDVNELLEVLEKHKARLLALPGCTGVAIGYKEVAGEVIDQLAIIVFVEKKQKDMAADYLVPAILDGVPVDVVEKTFGYKKTATDPFARFPQVFSGISITPRDASEIWGTFGCIIHTTGNAQVPNGNYLLTNQHVLLYADPQNPNSRWW